MLWEYHTNECSTKVNDFAYSGIFFDFVDGRSLYFREPEWPSLVTLHAKVSERESLIYYACSKILHAYVLSKKSCAQNEEKFTITINSHVIGLAL